MVGVGRVAGMKQILLMIAVVALVFDGYTTNRLTGSIVLVEPNTNATAAAGMLRGPEKVYQPEYDDFMI